MTYTFHTSVRGSSHLQTGAPCQDASLSATDTSRGITLALVSDGHGSPQCYRSDLGAWTACEVARQCLGQFADEWSPRLPQPMLDMRVKQLFVAIVEQWQSWIAYDLALPVYQLTREQLQTYGCTLIGYLQTPHFWLGFQIGDGKLLVKERHGERWKQPVPWDEDCLLHVTTSLCQSHSDTRFRYHYCEDLAPGAVFLGSDGLDDTFGDGAGLERFYDHVLDSVITDGLHTVQRQMPRVLRHYSEVGSHDDMSLAVVINL